MAFAALSVAMAYLHWRPIWQQVVLLGSAVPDCHRVQYRSGYHHGLYLRPWQSKIRQGILSRYAGDADAAAGVRPLRGPGMADE